MRRGIPCRIVTIGHGENDGRDDFPDIRFDALASKEELSALDDTLVFITYPLNVPTKHPSYVILHCPPMANGVADPLFDYRGMKGKRLIVPSRFAGKLWGRELGRSPLRIPVAHPFAESYFREVKRSPEPHKAPRILFAGRLTPDKGIYTLLAALHLHGLDTADIEITATSAGMHSDDGKIIYQLLKAHPRISLVPARKNAKAVAELMAEHDIIVMPSTNQFWKEAFGIVSVEAQHAGCRVVASKAGGLPETDCGGLISVQADNPLALAKGLTKAISLGALTEAERAKAVKRFTVQASVDALLRIISKQERKAHPHVGGVRLDHLSPQLALFGGRLRQSVAPHSYQSRSSLASPKN
jgi:D-inositol-3-phosphate glycosyltransferase